MSLRHAATLLIAVIALACTVPASAQDKTVTLKVSIWLPPSHPLVGSLRDWTASIEADSHGTIKSLIFPSEQLGKAFDHYDMARDGIADVAYVNPGYQPGRFPIFDAALLPFMENNGVAGSTAVDEWYRPYAVHEMADTHYCFGFIHDPGTLHSRSRITVPADMKGMKVRPAHAMFGEFDTVLGATNVQASAPESRDVLERGVADAIAFPYGSLILFGIDKVTKFHLDVPLYTSAFVISINQAKYDGMTAAQRAVIDAHCTPEWAEKVAASWAAFESAGRDKIRAMPGHTMTELTPAQLAEWRTAAAPLTRAWADSVRRVGVDPDVALAALKERLAAHNSAY